MDWKMYPLLKSLDRDERWGMYNIPYTKYDRFEIIDDFTIAIDANNPNFERVIIHDSTQPYIAIDYDKLDNFAAFNRLCEDTDDKMKRAVEIALDLLKNRGAKTIQMFGIIDFDLINFFKYGETWYEQHFGFKLISTHLLKKYEESKRRRKMLTYLDRLECASSELFTEDILDVFQKIVGLNLCYNVIWEKTL
jgi:hypothetical protein